MRVLAATATAADPTISRKACSKPSMVLEPLRRYFLESGLDEVTARNRAAAIDAFVLGVSTRRRVPRSELGDPDELRAWLSTTIQRLADG